LLAIFATAALLIGAIVIGIVLVNNRDQNNTATPPTTSSSSQRTSSQPSTTVASSTPPRSTARPTSSAPSTTASRSSAASSPATSTSPVSGAPTASQLAGAVRDYYGLLPGNTDAAWSRLTESFQNGRAGGRQSYDAYWGSIRRVSVSNVVGIPPGTVQATVSYVYKDGRRVTERNTFGLVSEGGVLKINSQS
jgi:hypothetical protein